MNGVCVKYVSQKVRKVCWKPVPKNINQKPDVFVTGGWDNKVNAVSVWQIVQPEAGANNSSLENDPKLLFEIPFDGDVTGLKYWNSDYLVTASSSGTVSIYKHHRSFQAHSLKIQNSWPNSHHFQHASSPCTGVAVYGDIIVSIGEDGRLISYNVNRKTPDIIATDSGTITAVTFLKQNEVITANSFGQLKLWDMRSQSNEPSRLLLMSGEHNSLMCLSNHPTQSTILACGSEDGTLSIWDLKQDKCPATLLSAHDGPMLDLKFHPISPSHLFTSSMDGMIWHWDASALTMPTVAPQKLKTPGDSMLTGANQMNPWMLCSDASKNHLEICSLIPSSRHPINSLDILEDLLLCGSDNEAYYIVNNLKF